MRVSTRMCRNGVQIAIKHIRKSFTIRVLVTYRKVMLAPDADIDVIYTFVLRTTPPWYVFVLGAVAGVI